MVTKDKKTFVHLLVSSKAFWFIFILFGFSFPIFRVLTRELPKPLPSYGVIPSFELLTEDNLNFKNTDLLGKVTISQFIFLNCPTVCKASLKNMKKIQKRVRGLGNKIALLSFSVDPENDTSKDLFKRARELKANPFVWKFITGEKIEMENLLIKGFKVPIGDKSLTENVYDIAHSEKFVLSDKNGKIRGYYGKDKNEINRLMIDVGLLVNNAFKN
jgi:protein SCO1